MRGFLQLDADQPGVANPIPLPQLSSGPYLSYGIQWIAFGILAPLGLAYFVWAEVRERRRVREEDVLWEGLDDAALSGDSPDPKRGDDPAHESAVSYTTHPDNAAIVTNDRNTKNANDGAGDNETLTDSGKSMPRAHDGTSEPEAEKSASKDSPLPEKTGSRRQAKLYDRYGGTRSNFDAKRLQRDEERF